MATLEEAKTAYVQGIEMGVNALDQMVAEMTRGIPQDEAARTPDQVAVLTLVSHLGMVRHATISWLDILHGNTGEKGATDGDTGNDGGLGGAADESEVPAG